MEKGIFPVIDAIYESAPSIASPDQQLFIGIVIGGL